jgi:hypothetical protein
MLHGNSKVTEIHSIQYSLDEDDSYQGSRCGTKHSERMRDTFQRMTSNMQFF